MICIKTSVRPSKISGLGRKETNNSFLKEKSEYIYDSKAFRKWYHENNLQIEREIQLNSIFK